MRKLLKKIYEGLPFKKQAFTLLRSVWTPPQRVYQHLHFRDTFSVPLNGSGSFSIRHYGYEVENELFWNGIDGGWEKVSSAVWMALCKKSSVIIDIGANTGLYALVAKTVQPQARVYAFEPVQRVFRKLEDNVTLNRYDIGCFEMAVSDADGEARIWDTNEEHIYSVTVNENLAGEGKAVPITIRTCRLDSFIKQEGLDRIDLMKVDVETHEPQVLAGMGPYLERFRPALLIEILNDEVGTRVEALVRNLGYVYFNIDELGGLRREEHIRKSDYYNYLLCPPHLAEGLPHIQPN